MLSFHVRIDERMLAEGTLELVRANMPNNTDIISKRTIMIDYRRDDGSRLNNNQPLLERFEINEMLLFIISSIMKREQSCNNEIRIRDETNAW